MERITHENFLKRTRRLWKTSSETVFYSGCERYNHHTVSIKLEFQLPRVTEQNTILPEYSDDRRVVLGVCLAVPESQMFVLAPGAELPRWNVPEKEKRMFTTEQLHAAHTFKWVKDLNDQLAVGEVARKLHEGLPDDGDFSLIEHLLLCDYINLGDEYMCDELQAIFEETIWEGKMDGYTASAT